MTEQSWPNQKQKVRGRDKFRVESRGMAMSDVVQMYNDAEKLRDEGKVEEAIAKLVDLLSDRQPTYAIASCSGGSLWTRRPARKGSRARRTSLPT